MKLQHLSPILWTYNLEETAAFYTNILGFSAGGTFPNYLRVSRDEIDIMFILPADKQNQKLLITGNIYIFIDDVDELWTSIRDSAKIVTAIDDRQYLMRDFSILDNNGYELVFGQDISQHNQV